jgi:Flp pilus assembly protein TadB
MTNGFILLLALAAGAVSFLILREIITVTSNDPARAIRDSQTVPAVGSVKSRKGPTSQLGALLARHIPSYVEKLKNDLYWVIFEDNSEKKVVVATEVSQEAIYDRLGKQILMSWMLGLIAFLALKSPAALIIGGLAGWLLNRSDLKARAASIRGQLAQELPEFIQLLAAETASGAGLDMVIARVSEGPGLAPLWMRNVLAQAQGQSLFAAHKNDARGLLHYEASRSGDAHLIDLAVQLRYALKGLETRALLQSLASRHADDFVSQASIRAKKLGNSLSAIAALFFFVPFLIILLLVVGVPVLSMFSGG